ncbi:hypothetical protein D9619_004547 [Psilocybe cf. subviscida]|uniref:Methyltransferase domain-containing protein n=1 Tax=Psilocybe cf. subviscida TaxID=2480587 RepID=A0A8H5F819_9AGAR|nr:hypothetical protein D9619_004547 [Psilocybe cf. subviscida]
MSTDANLLGFDPSGQSNPNNSFPLSPEELSFFKSLTKIDNEEQLRAHIVSVQKAAYKVFSYSCIRKFAFVQLTLTHQRAYRQAINLRIFQRDPILLDIGCCFGTDVRKVVLDGWPAQFVIASDIRQEFWDYGHKLFLSTAESLPVRFIAGDILDPSILQPREPIIDEKEITAILGQPTPSVSEVQNLTPLLGKISAIHASSLFHLFSEVEQLALARCLASLLRPEKGSVIFGQHVGRKVMGHRAPYIGDVASLAPMFCHSPQSWSDLWVTQVFGGNDGRGNERIKVDVEFVDVNWVVGKEIFQEVEPNDKFYMQWCITRL